MFSVRFFSSLAPDTFLFRLHFIVKISFKNLNLLENLIKSFFHKLLENKGGLQLVTQCKHALQYDTFVQKYMKEKTVYEFTHKEGSAGLVTRFLFRRQHY